MVRIFIFIVIIQSQVYHKINLDFINDSSIEQITPDTLGLLSFRGYFPDNKFGNTFGYIVHKNGGKWWFKNSKKRFPKDIGSKGKYLSHFKAAARLMKEDRDSMKNFNKWVFFIDKKYLDIHTEVDGETGKKSLSAYTKERQPLEVILFHQMAGNKTWYEIDRKKFSTDNEYEKSSWRMDFIERKLIESNQQK